MNQINAGTHRPALYMSQARWLHGQGKSEEALALLTQAEQRGIAKEHVASAKANILEAMGRDMEASALRMERINAGSRNTAFYSKEVRWLYTQGREADAIHLLDFAEQRGMSSDYVASIKANNLEALGRSEEASAVRVERISAGSHNPVFYVGEAIWLRNQGKSDEALALLAQAEQRGITNDYIISIKANVLEALGRSAEASTLRVSQANTGDDLLAFVVSEDKWLRDQQKSDELVALLGQQDNVSPHDEPLENKLLEELDLQQDQE
jgi:hypothetical protein